MRSVAANETISPILIEGAREQTGEALIATLNEIFDVYADEDSEYDRVFRENGYLDRLRQAQVHVKQVVRGDNLCVL